MRIAVLCNGYGYVQRGSERFTEQFTRHMSKWFELNVFSVNDTMTPRRGDIRFPWRNGRAYLESYLFARALHRRDMLRGYDVVVNNAGPPASIWCNMVRRRHSIPFISRARGGGREEYLSRLMRPDMMVFLTDEHRRVICPMSLTPSVVIPNAIDPDDYRGGDTSLFDGLEKPIYFSASAFVGFKRHHLIIDAVSRLPGTLVMAGDGELREETVRYARDMLGNRYRYMGNIEDRNMLLSAYRSSDVYVDASKEKGFANVYLEAIACGLPLVLQDSSRFRDALGHSSAVFFCNCSNTEAFAGAIETAVGSHPSLDDIAPYTWDAIEKAWKTCLEEVT